MADDSPPIACHSSSQLIANAQDGDVYVTDPVDGSVQWCYTHKGRVEWLRWSHSESPALLASGTTGAITLLLRGRRGLSFASVAEFAFSSTLKALEWLPSAPSFRTAQISQAAPPDSPTTLPLGYEGFIHVNANGVVSIRMRHGFGTQVADAAEIKAPAGTAAMVSRWLCLTGQLQVEHSVSQAAVCSTGAHSSVLVAILPSAFATNVILHRVALPTPASKLHSAGELEVTPLNRVSSFASVTHLSLLQMPPSSAPGSTELLLLTRKARRSMAGQADTIGGVGTAGPSTDEGRIDWCFGVELWGWEASSDKQSGGIARGQPRGTLTTLIPSEHADVGDDSLPELTGGGCADEIRQDVTMRSPAWACNLVLKARLPSDGNPADLEHLSPAAWFSMPAGCSRCLVGHGRGCVSLIETCVDGAPHIVQLDACPGFNSQRGRLLTSPVCSIGS